jgi:aconitate hydratase
MSVADRATIANMAPEYGATVGIFPVDEQTLSYLRLTGRDAKQIDLVERYCKEQGLWRDDSTQLQFSEVLTLDLGTVPPSLAGPRRPQDRVDLKGVRGALRGVFADAFAGQETSADARLARFGHEPPAGVFRGHPKSAGATAVAEPQTELDLEHGDVVIAAITSCTNTSNPNVMMAAALLAKKAVEKGLKVPPHVKTSLSPGSRVVTDYFDKAGLTPYLDALGFQTTGYGCMTCIGNSGPLPEAVAAEVEKKELVACAVLSGNRNFEGRINPHVKANFLASPPLVVAYALAGTMDVDLSSEPVGVGRGGEKVFLKDIWPSQQEVDRLVASCVSGEMFRRQYENVGSKNAQWNAVPVRGGALYDFDPASPYIQEPPFLAALKSQPEPIRPIKGARVLVMVGDSVTTDHISPAGSIKKDSPAGKYLIEQGVDPRDFNSYGARRGNDRVMTRGTFANIRLKNLLAPGTEGGVTTYPPGGAVMPIFDASMRYQHEGTPLVVLAGKDYGMGSSRDWAAKGTFLLGVKAVIAESFERIHRSYLLGMGVLPLVYEPGQTRTTLGLSGLETFDIAIDPKLQPGQRVTVFATSPDGTCTHFTTICRIDTPVETEYFRNGGIMQTVLRKTLRGG